jgi:putative membrane protein insertion efficiency factor
VKPVVLFAIRVYQKTLSRLLPLACRFYPSCSEYMYEAVEKKGVISGVFLGVKRLTKCHPWNPGGFDPVP